MMKRNLKIILLALAMLFLCIPMLQQIFHFSHKSYPLYGFFEKKKDTTLTKQNWFSGIYQRKMDAYLNENFGFRNFLVKLDNQINFSLYEKINVIDVYKGKNNYLYTYRFFNTYSGKNYKGDKYADSVFKQVQRLNDWLTARNKKLLICFAPCKESFFPENIPAELMKEVKPKNYYDYYSKEITGSKIPFIDFHKYFQSLKGKSPYPLFTQGALHWTGYGANLALDTFLNRISFEIGKKSNGIRVKSIEVSDTARGADDDISKAMNLLVDVNSEKLAYPSIEFIYNKDSCYRPKVMIVGDSFYYGLNNTWVPLTAFSKDSYFLYYFQQAISQDPEKKDSEVKDLDFVKELENTDIVVLFFTMANLDNFPYKANEMIDRIKK